MTPTTNEHGFVVHDTSDPLGCCDRCRTAELSRRRTKRPTLLYSRTASRGIVYVQRGSTEVAALIRDRSGRWHVQLANDFRTVPELSAVDSHLFGAPRIEALADLEAAYTAAWRKGAVK